MYEIVLAGFGGQGIMAQGVILANAGMRQGKHTSWIPAYGAEQRGGTANCTVKISEEEIGTPFYDKPDILVAMNGPSLETFKKIIKPDGLILANSSLISKEQIEADDRIIGVPATDIARDLGDIRAANVVLLGAMLKKIEVVSDEYLIKSISEFFHGKGEKIIDLNELAFSEGAKSI